MLYASRYFRDVTLENVVTSLQALPSPVKPVYFSENDERPEAPVFVRRASRKGITFVKINLLADETGFDEYRKDHPSGVVLYSENNTIIDVSIGDGNTVVAMYLENQPDRGYVTDFIRCLNRHKPLFGYACEESEYDHRHRHCITLGKHRIESWIGRSLEKYVTGAYWYTLLSSKVMEKHGVVLSDLSAEAFVVETLGDDSLQLVKFYDKAEDWQQHADRLDALCERTSGIFSRRSVETSVSCVTNFIEYCDVVDAWP